MLIIDWQQSPQPLHVPQVFVRMLIIDWQQSPQPLHVPQ
jgi:hypothetical protein